MTAPRLLAALRAVCRAPLTAGLILSTGAHLGAIALLMTPQRTLQEIRSAGGFFAVSVVLVEGPEQHAGDDRGDDRERAAAASAAADAAPPASLPPPADRARSADRRPERTETTAVPPADEPPVPAAPVTAAIQPQSGTLTVRPPPPPPKPRPPPAVAPIAGAQAAPSRESFEDVEEPPAVTGERTRRPGTAAHATLPSQGDARTIEPGAHAGGTRGAAPRGDNPKPTYPYGARLRGEEGRVLLDVRVRSDGTAAGVTVAESSGHESLDQAALATVRRWRFVPARRNGVPVSAEVRVPIRFRLR